MYSGKRLLSEHLQYMQVRMHLTEIAQDLPHKEFENPDKECIIDQAHNLSGHTSWKILLNGVRHHKVMIQQIKVRQKAFSLL